MSCSRSYPSKARIQFIYPKVQPFEMWNSVVFNILAEVYIHHHYLIPEDIYYWPKKNASYSLAVALYDLSSLQALATTNLFSVSMDLTILDNSYKWNHVTCSLCVWFLSFSKIFSRFIHVVPCIRTLSLSLQQIIFHFMNYHILLTHSLWTSRLFLLLDYFE